MTKTSTGASVFAALKPIALEDLPQATRNRKTAVTSSEFWPDVKRVLEETKARGKYPYKFGLEIIVNQATEGFRKIKNPALAIMRRVRSEIASAKLENELDIVKLDRNRLFLVPRKAESNGH